MPRAISAQTSIAINAPIERVWQVMTDVAAYPQWNPFVVNIDAAGDVTMQGTAMKFTVKWLDGGTATSQEIVTEAQVPYADSKGVKHAHWAYVFNSWLHRFGLVHAIRHQWLEQQPGSITIYRTEEVFTGLLKKFIPLAKVQDGFERQAKALAHFAEQQ